LETKDKPIPVPTPDTLRSDRSDRKISHSRIIKTFNPISGVQTKIITYPDLTEIFKLRESRKSNPE
jgi:hypothetical protein